MNELMNVASLPAIVAITYGLIEAYKLVVGQKETALRIIPIIAGVLGGGLGIAIFYLYPQIIPASDVLTALIIGVSSGLSATGANQVFKQIVKGKGESNGNS